jgi:hypothetical protein
MDSYFREAFEGMKQAAEGIIKVNHALLTANEEHEDLRETVSRLESTVLVLVKEVRELRDKKGGGV